MAAIANVNRFARWLRARAAATIDALPPYKWIQGSLADKGSDAQGNHYILVGNEIVLVDWLTYDTLMLGEPLRIRSTRANRAINIDRLLP